jgi:hypothetical protein
MGNNDLTQSENILIKVDQNNLIYIDPNSVLDENGQVQPRGVKQEKLVMYANLEADLIPRTTLIADGNKNTLTSIAKGTLNFLSRQDGKDFDSSWTDTFVPESSNENTFQFTDKTGQSFGIDSISVNIKGANFIPQITINFIDVRGKTLFESPENSPYKAFFHLPWPIFYLTLKGYYGKAIRYRLHLVKFSSRYNESNGNFEISTNFVGSTYAYLTDIPINGVLNSPYMFLIESTKEPKKFNEQTKKYEQKVSKSSKGYSILKSIYDEYKSKGLVDKNFPVRTLRELITIAQSLDKILEKAIFDQVVDMKIFAGVKEFEKKIQDFESTVKLWGQQNLSTDFVKINNKTYFLQKGLDKDKNSLNKITGSTTNGTLEKIITTYVDDLKKSSLFANDLIKKGGSDFKNITFNFVNSIGKIKDYYEYKDGKYVVAGLELVSKILEIQKSFVEQRSKLENKVEEVMNNIIKDPNKGIGFEPTIRNIFAVILANADVYIRLMKDTHYKAFEASERRKDIIKGLSDESKGEPIYPWPEIKKNGSNKQKTISYPGDPDLQETLQSYDKILWPEVDFVENYNAVASKRIDPLGETEGNVSNISFIFESNSTEYQSNNIGTFELLSKINPYTDKSVAAILYEIWERSKATTFYNSFNNETIKELADIEFKNISKCLEEDFDLIDILKDKVGTPTELRDLMMSFSTYERYPYYRDQLYTTPYLKDLSSKSHKIEYYIPGDNSKTNNDELYPKLNNNLLNYKVETYRKNIYPFNSSTYLSYLNKTDLTDNDFNFTGILKVDTLNALISSPINPASWVKNDVLGIYKTNLFSQGLEINGKQFNLLNTPYFHKQLYTDFSNQKQYGKYVGSAYLLLNSLPFKDLEDKISFPFTELGGTESSTLMSSMFREIGSTHYIPYHLILKWGSIYHRYKKFILDGYDIINSTPTLINGQEFFDNNSGNTYTVSGTTVDYGDNEDVGLYPYYQNIYHQIINDYSFYNTTQGNSSYSGTTINGKNLSRKRNKNLFNSWTSLIDNSKYVSTSTYYTLLPSDGNSTFVGITGFTGATQTNFRVIWGNDSNVNEYEFYSGTTLPSYNEYFRKYKTGSTKDNIYTISDNKRKVFDLIATFSPSVLEDFENAFLEFSSENLNIEIPYRRFERQVEITNKTGSTIETVGVKHYNFQQLLKEISTVDKKTNDTTIIDNLIKLINERQVEKLKSITKEILSNDNLIKLTISNPKEIDPYILGGFTNVDVDNFSYNEYDNTQTGNTKYIKLYLGEDLDGYYLDFFENCDVELNEDNVLFFRPLIQIYAGRSKKIGSSLNKQSFITYLKDNIILPTNSLIGGTVERLSLFLTILTSKFSNLSHSKNVNRLTIMSGYNDNPLKLELYNFFKSFNDKWIGGNSIGQRLLLEEFLFLDKANVDIGNKVFLDLQKLIPLEDPKNSKQNLYGMISSLIAGTGFDMRALPSYVNFYGTNFSNKTKLTPSDKIAQNMFGTFLEVDYQESSPKIILQYTGPTSKHLDMKDINDKYKFLDDSFNIGNTNKNPLIITTPNVFDIDNLKLSNKVVSFEVSFGDQNQGIFKGVQLDQNSLKNTSESFIVAENMGRSEGGAATHQIDVGLFDIYRQASYTCDVTCLGNVMIQPTMYFYLKNIPMFKGTYWITEVNHNIRNNTISTSFKGVRIPTASLPDPKDSFTSSYRVLFDKVMNTAIARIKQESLNVNGENKNEKSLTTNSGTFTIDMGADNKKINGEKLVEEAGVTKYGVPYNGDKGEKYIQKVLFENKTYLRSIVVTMGGKNYNIEDNMDMSLINQVSSIEGTTTSFTDKIKWSDLKDDKKTDFYSLKFALDVVSPNTIIKGTTTFFNPNNKKTVTIQPINQPSITKSNIKGPINIGPKINGYGIGLSSSLMKKLGLFDGDVVYFNIS